MLHEEIITDFHEGRPFTENLESYSIEKLNELFEKIDSDKNSLVSKPELIDWIIKLSLNELNKRANADVKFYDLDKNERISWIEMLQTTYGFTEESVEQILKSKDPADKDNYEFIIEDRNRFQAADSDGDGFLTHDEYKGLLNPSENPKLMKLSIDKIMDRHDKDKDSKMDEKEFKSYFYSTDELTNLQKEEFDNIFRKYDFNKDSKLSAEELEKWYAPDLKIAATFETDDLIIKSDKNNDQLLSLDEVKTALSDWKTSQATNYGEHIRDEL